MQILVAIILGIVEGITEFLPISSTGHLIVSQAFLNFKDVNEMFTVVVQLGAIAAVIWYYRKDLFAKTVGLLRHEREAVNFWKILALGTLPAGLIGLAVESGMEKISAPLVVAIALILGGIILWVVDRKPVEAHGEVSDPEFHSISTKRALLIGLGQCAAIVPGVSRSGATIVTGLMTGLNRTTATAFSFYLAIPVIVLASAYKLYKYGDQLDQIAGGAPALVAGLVTAFITALLSISWLLKYVSRHNFKPFAYYRIGFGVFLLVLIWGTDIL